AVLGLGVAGAAYTVDRREVAAPTGRVVVSHLPEETGVPGLVD
ncbi:MFS transporter, partial [Streptomyces sp. SID89]|nr:MFS transporter [Streptomyces sp. SID89]